MTNYATTTFYLRGECVAKLCLTVPNEVQRVRLEATSEGATYKGTRIDRVEFARVWISV